MPNTTSRMHPPMMQAVARMMSFVTCSTQVAPSELYMYHGGRSVLHAIYRILQNGDIYKEHTHMLPRYMQGSRGAAPLTRWKSSHRCAYSTYCFMQDKVCKEDVGNELHAAQGCQQGLRRKTCRHNMRWNLLKTPTTYNSCSRVHNKSTSQTMLHQALSRTC